MAYKITSADIQLIASARTKQRYGDLSEAELAAYSNITSALRDLGGIAQQQLRRGALFSVKLTSGFHIQSGVRGSIPKDLWFSVSPTANAKTLAGMPQLFMIVSERGIEYGFGASVSPRDFSQQQVKELVRHAAPQVFRRMPAPDAPETRALAAQLEEQGDWYFRSKHRLVPNQPEFKSLAEWLSYLTSRDGQKNAAGTVSRYVLPQEVDQVDLEHEVAQMAQAFEVLLDRDWLQSPDGRQPQPMPQNAQTAFVLPQDPIEIPPQQSFADRFTEFLQTFTNDKKSSFRVGESLKAAMQSVEAWLTQAPAVASRPNLKVKISVGQGSWTETPWIALLDQRETQSTQNGRYVVFLIAADLSTTYLTLNQGMTKLVEAHGQPGAVRVMHQVAAQSRQRLPHLGESGFTLDRDIDLKSHTSASRNYQDGTIAYVELPTHALPTDEELHAYLEAILAAYETLISEPEEEDVVPPVIEPPVFTIEDCLQNLFLDKEEVERLLAIWKDKRNLILQGAPGVGKSFIARNLAYALIGAKDPSRVEVVQFHQSYSYEDFVQGYRPDGKGGFVRKNGSFFDFVQRAIADPPKDYVFIIDEINRGNLSKIFGELMLLVEADKRSPEWRTRLAYGAEGEAGFYVPDNIFILGMMNTADRSLSLVDYALRRRFAFVTMHPLFERQKFAAHLEAQSVSESVQRRIIEGMTRLNGEIAADRANLGPGFRIGHSFFTPKGKVQDAEAWFARVVETEIAPLLEEYYFDDPEKAEELTVQLLGRRG